MRDRMEQVYFDEKIKTGGRYGTIMGRALYESNGQNGLRLQCFHTLWQALISWGYWGQHGPCDHVGQAKNPYGKRAGWNP